MNTKVVTALYTPGAIAILCLQETLLAKEEGIPYRIACAGTALILSPCILLSACCIPFMKK